ncbi:MAG TPA: ABC transporter permease [Bryobacteraceae bacterium]|jgi:predicted permease|nr:ABC transporter permease [Bryobacteraceae bacterium]
MSSFASDLRHSIRVLLNSPGFTTIAVAALALGIGANTAIFSVVNTVLLQPLPYPEPDRIMRVERSFPGGVGSSSSIPKFMAWRKNQVFEALTIHDFSSLGLNLGTGDHPEQVNGIHVSQEYFRVFGAAPALGRTFLPQEDLPGGAKVTVLSNDLWKARLGGDPLLIGKPLILSGDRYTVVGILPAGFHSDPPADLFIPLQADPNSNNQGHYLNVAGRLKPGVTVEAARANMKLAGEEFRRANPNWMGPNENVTVVPLREALVGDVRPALLILVGAVGFVLLIACANVANLLLARASARHKEIAIRTAVGASRGRLVSQLLTESVLLAAVSGLVGFLIGAWGVRILLALSPGNLPRVNERDHVVSAVTALDWHVLAFTLGIAVLTGVVFGLFPALHISKLDVNSVLKETSGRSGTGLRQNRARSILVASEMALAVILLVGAALMIRTFIGLRSVQPGFDPHNVITMQTSLTGGRYDSTAKVETMVRQVVQRIEALPGAQSAAETIVLPVEGGIDLPFLIEGRPLANGDRYTGDEQWRSVSPHYFTAFRIPLLRGRMFEDRDTGKSERVMIINQAMAKKYWPKGDPVGQRVTIGKGLGPQFEEPTRQVIGVVGDVRENGLSTADQGVMYVPQAQMTDPLTQFAVSVIPLSWAIRTAADPTALTSAIQRELQAVDSQLPIAKIRTMEQVVSESTARQNFNMLLLSIFAGLALLLAAIGIYGLMSYTVEQRTQEIGIRMALGAGRGDMLKLIVRQGMLLAGIGVAIGLGAAFGLARLLASLLFGVKTTDPFTYAAVALILTSVALFATYVPARRATKIDPLIALRYE